MISYVVLLYASRLQFPCESSLYWYLSSRYNVPLIKESLSLYQQMLKHFSFQLGQLINLVYYSRLHRAMGCNSAQHCH
jgi:hypothetical protein